MNVDEADGGDEGRVRHQDERTILDEEGELLGAGEERNLRSKESKKKELERKREEVENVIE